MNVDSAVFYLPSLALVFLFSWLLARLPFHSRQDAKDLANPRILSLDGLRGILAVSVFFHHAIFLYIFLTTGAWGVKSMTLFFQQLGVFPVAMFFFITGYLFWTKLMKRPNFPKMPFWYARLARLGPAYWAACFLLFVLTAVFSHFHRNVSPGKLVVQALAWLSFIGGGHAINQMEDSKVWLGQVWTLRFEWLFYLTLPFLGWFARRRLRLPLFLAGAGLLVFLGRHFHLHGAAGLAESMLVDFLSFVFFTFSVGMIVAALPFTKTWIAWCGHGAATVVSLLLIGVALFFVPAEYGWLESLVLAVPFMCVCLGNTWFGLLVSQPVRFLGRISYSLYLLHSLVLTVGGHLLAHYVKPASLNAIQYWFFAAGCAALSILAASISYQFLEHPYLHVGPPLPLLGKPTPPPSA